MKNKKNKKTAKSKFGNPQNKQILNKEESSDN